MGLTSRAGVIPLSSAADIAGPMARTVSDAVEIFNVVAGADSADPVTLAARDHREPDYRKFLVPGGLSGARIGVLRQAYESRTTDSEVVAVFTKALDDMRKAGATIVDPAEIPSLRQVTRGGNGCSRFKYDLERYFAERGEGAPVKTVAQIVRSRAYHPSVESRLLSAMRDSSPPPDVNPRCKAHREMADRLRGAVTALMDSLHLDALVYPTWSNPPRLIGDLNTPAGDNSQLFSPTTGFPAITVPMGYTRGDRLPAGITFFGRAWSEGKLITLSYGYEQATHHRRAPASTSGR
jgi:Asp-tRNA(Asn)/Glu-tRNA(Gln) amidotransferase A subunit family amidase